MTKAEPGYYWFVTCIWCEKEIIIDEATPEIPFATKKSSRVTCQACGTTHTYPPREMQLGDVEK